MIAQYIKTMLGQRLLQVRYNEVYLKQNFGWPDQPSSGLDDLSLKKAGLASQNFVLNMRRCVNGAVVFDLSSFYFSSLAG